VFQPRLPRPLCAAEYARWTRAVAALTATR